MKAMQPPNIVSGVYNLTSNMYMNSREDQQLLRGMDGLCKLFFFAKAHLSVKGNGDTKIMLIIQEYVRNYRKKAS